MTRLWIKEMMQKKHEEHVKRMKEIESRIDNRHDKQSAYGRDRKKERTHRYAQVERRNREIIDHIGRAMSTKYIDNGPPPKRINVSLGEVSKRRELDRITHENQKILNRIQQVQPFYTRAEWTIENNRRLQVLATISEFPEAYATRAKSATLDRSKRENLHLPSIQTGRNSVRTAPTSSTKPLNHYDPSLPLVGEEIWGEFGASP